MHQVIENLFVGSDADVDEFREDYPGGHVIHAAKEPWHRQALGYTGRGAPKGDPEYLVAHTPDALCLNLVDAPKPEFIPRECFEAAASDIEECLNEGIEVLVHCNQGHSRGPGVALYAMRKLGVYHGSFEAALEDFQIHYPDLELGEGVLGALQQWWEDIE